MTATKTELEIENEARAMHAAAIFPKKNQAKLYEVRDTATGLYLSQYSGWGVAKWTDKPSKRMTLGSSGDLVRVAVRLKLDLSEVELRTDLESGWL